MGEIVPIAYSGQISLYYKPRTQTGVLSLDIVNTTPLSSGPIVCYYDADLLDGNENATISQIVEADISLYHTPYDNSAERPPGFYSQMWQFPIVPWLSNFPPAPVPVYSYRPSIEDVVNPNRLGTWERMPGPPEVINGVSVLTWIPAVVSCTNVSSSDLGVSLHSKTVSSVEEYGACDPNANYGGIPPLPSLRYPLLNGLTSDSSVEDVINSGVVIYNPSTNVAIFPRYYSFGAAAPSNLQDVNVYRLLSSSLPSGTCLWSEDVITCNQILAPSGTVRSMTVNYNTALGSDNCGIENPYTIYYISNTVISSVEALAVAGYSIWVTQELFPEGTLPEYWQLIHAPSGAYGSNPYQAYLWDIDLANPLTWRTFNPNPSGISDIFLQPSSTETIYGYYEYNTTNCPIEPGVYVRSIQIYKSAITNDELGNIFCVSLSDTFNQPEYVFYRNEEDSDLSLMEISERQISIYDTYNGAAYELQDKISSTSWCCEIIGLYYKFDISKLPQNEAWRARDDRASSFEYNYPYVCSSYSTLETSSFYMVKSPSNGGAEFTSLYDIENEYRIRYKVPTQVKYRRHISGPQFTLDEIAKYGIPLYVWTPLPSPFPFYNNFALGDNQDTYYIYTAGEEVPKYIGLNSNGSIASSQVVAPITSQPFELPENNTGVLSDGAGIGIFYAFKTCADIGGTQRVYIVYGNHTNETPPSERGEIYNLVTTIGVGSTFYTTSADFSITDLEVNSAKTYIHTIVASSPTSARSVLVNAGYDFNDILFVDPSVLGLVGISAGVYYNGPCYDCINTDPSILPSFSFLEKVDVEEDKFEPRLDLEKNYVLDNISKPLLRTNPKLSSNIKLIVDSDDNLYLESINATKDLADSKYKAYSISSTGSYSYDVSRFYNDNKTPYEMAYSVKRDSSDYSALSDYSKQFEGEYQYGARFNRSKMYDESFRIFAPIWLDLNVPSKFLVYRIDGPSPSIDYGDSPTDKAARVESILKNATLIKVFDLSEASNLGQYIRNHVNDSNFPKDMVSVSFEKNEQTFFNGIDISKGGFARKGEFIFNDFIYDDKTLIESNDFITDGFRRNRLISANLMNLEFMFDDINAEDFTVNRYVGIYADSIPSGRGEVSGINDGLIKFSSLESYMDSQDVTYAIPGNDMLKNAPVLAYVTSKHGYSNIKNGSYYNPNSYNVKISDKGAKLEDYKGIVDTGRSISIKKNMSAGNDFVKISVIDTPVDLDQITIVDVKREAYRLKFINHVPQNIDDTISFLFPIQTQVAFNSGNSHDEGLQNIVDAVNSHLISSYVTAEIEQIKNIDGDLIKTVVIKEKKIGLTDISLSINRGNPSSVISVEKLSTSINILNNTFIAKSNLDAGRINGNEFSLNGTTGQIAMAITSCINAKGTFRAINNGSDIYVISKAAGYKLMRSAVLLSTSNIAKFIDIENEDISNDLDLDLNALSKYKSYYLKGGNSAGRSLLIHKDSLGAINIGELLPTSISSSYTEVIDIVENIDDITGDYYKIVLNKTSDLKDGIYKVFFSFKSEMGLFSCYDFYDMDFDFYDTSNSMLKELELETIENTDYLPSNNPELIDSELINKDYFKSTSDLFSNLLPILDQETPEDSIITHITSEYDRLNENYLKELSTASRVVPTINKFILDGCKTVRNNPYYLNVNEAFGRTNFAPDLDITDRNPLSFTHEWFYIADLPNYFTYDTTNKSFSYVNFVKGKEISKDMFLSIDHDYFDVYMVSDGFTVEVEDNPENDYDNFDIFSKTILDKKYSVFKYGSEQSFSSSFFNGIKVLVKKRKDTSSENALEFIKDSSLNEYRFSTLVRFNTNTLSSDITYDVIKNDKFKFIILFIEVDLSERYVDGKLNRRLLYTLDNKLKISGDTFSYDDVRISGALIFSGINFNEQGPYEVGAVQHNDGSLPNLDIQLSVLEGDVYGDIEIDYGITDANENPVIYTISVKGVKGYNSLIVSGPPVDSEGNELDPTYISYAMQLNATYVYKGGGKNTHKYFLTRLSAGSIANLLNGNDPSVSYTSVKSDGSIVYDEFVLNFEDGKEIIKKSSLVSVQDTNKPSTYSLFNGTIGYNLSERTPYYPFLIRHSGNYTVSMKPVLTFTDVYSHHKINTDYYNPLSFLLETELTSRMYKHSIASQPEIDRSIAYYKKFNRLGVAFNIGFIQGDHDESWAMIKNHFYHKVNEDNPSGVTKLSESSEFLPVYPLIGEIAIDKTDISVLRSSWENNYYTKSISGGLGSKVPGTVSTRETRSYMSSTMMKLSDSYILTEFTVQYASNKTELEQILRNSNNTESVVILETDNNILIDFYLTDSIVDKFTDLGVLNEISKYVDPEFSEEDKTSLIDDSELYIKNNLISIFSVDSVEIYVSKRKDIQSSIESTSSIDLIDNGGFILDDGFSITKHSNSSINFRLIYNKSLGYSYIIRPLIKIKK